MMKKTIFVAVMALSAAFAAFSQSKELPRLAVVAFTGDATERDAKRVRDMVESVMVDSGHYDIISTDDIDQIIAQQKIALSSISSKENITKLERENIKYIVTGTVNREADEAFVSLRILDVKNARFIPNSPRGIIDMKSMTTIYAGVEAIASDFISGMSGNSGEVKRTGTTASDNRQTVNAPSVKTAPKPKLTAPANSSGIEKALHTAGDVLINILPESTTIAIISISSRDKDAAAFVIDELAYVLVNAGNYEVVDRKDLVALLREQGFQAGGEVDDDSAVFIGKLFGANVVITGSISGTDSMRRLRLKALDVKTAKLLAMASEPF